jgi:NADPH:quinone reductase-like Zn-dependent oxidoreductase
VSEQIPAAVLREYGQPPEFTTFNAPPSPSEGQVLVEVEAGGLNPVDIALSEKRYPIPPPPVPYVPGIEAVGRVLESAAEGFSAGDRLYVDLPAPPHGTFAALTVSHAATAVAVPEEVSGGLACALGIAGLAAYLSLGYRASLQPGEKVAVLGATGVVGHVAVQAARLMGASSIVAVGRNRERLEHTRELGATSIAVIGEGDLADAIREATDGGPNVVVDMLCGSPAEAALDATAPNGRLVQMGRSAAETMELRSAVVRGKSLTIFGHTNALTPPDVRRSAYEWLLGHAAADEIRVECERVPLAEVAGAWARQKASPGHKLVLCP